MILSEADYLEHVGVKGMRWGQRKSRSGPSRRQKRHQARQEKFEANQKLAKSFIETGLKEPETLILVNGQTVATGREFIDYMGRGGLLDVKTTRVYARKSSPKGPYVLEPRR